MAFEKAQQLCRAAAEGGSFDLAATLAELRELDEDERLGPSTGAIVDAAIARGIPIKRLTRGSLVQLGWGSQQRRIQAATNAGRAVDPEVFVTPSRNIICAVVPADATTGAACEIDQGRIRERRCGTGDGARDVGRIVFVRGVPTPECNSDTMFSSRSQRVLAYGWVAHVRQGSVECLSERAGVTCIDGGARRGFALSRGSYRLLR